MSELLGGPSGPIIGIAVSFFAAWRAAGLLEADNQIIAIAFGATLAIAGPFLIGDLLVGLAAAPAANHGADTLRDVFFDAGGSPMVLFATRLGFALIGVLFWCGLERAR